MTPVVPATDFVRFEDPLEPDDVRDEVVVTTRRALIRVALVATETAGRFQREAVGHDPMSWMLSPRSLFGGESAVDACLDREHCMRGVLLHGLSLGMDADPAMVDLLVDDDKDDVDDDADADEATVDPRSHPSYGDVRAIRPEAGSGDAGPLRLFTATVVAEDRLGTIHAFHASVARDASEILGRLRIRMGDRCADAAVVFSGFDASLPMVEALVSPALCDTLTAIGADPGSPLANGLDLHVEQRFHD